MLATLSNGNVALLVNMAKNAGLPWDAVLSAELAESYKPDPTVYRKAADLLGLEPEQVMMVAAHGGDLRASAEVGFRTAYVPRPLEYGPDSQRDIWPQTLRSTSWPAILVTWLISWHSESLRLPWLRPSPFVVTILPFCVRSP